MRKLIFVSATLSSMLAACSTLATSNDDPLSGSDCESPCTDEDGGGGDGDPVALSADLSIDIAGTGVFIGMDPLCSLDASGDFYAKASGKASFDGTSWVIADVGADVSIEAGNGCACSGVDIEVVASVDISATIEASLPSCSLFCEAHADARADAECSGNGDASCHASAKASAEASCNVACNVPGNLILADAAVEAAVKASIELGAEASLDELEGASLDVSADACVDASGELVMDL
jgi:hypothetical protein